MKKYRVVELAGGSFGVQKRTWLLFWRSLPLTSGYPNGAYSEIARLIDKEQQQLRVKKNLKVVRVHGYA
jgi:hypothetical protein